MARLAPAATKSGRIKASVAGWRAAKMPSTAERGITRSAMTPIRVVRRNCRQGSILGMKPNDKVVRRGHSQNEAALSTSSTPLYPKRSHRASAQTDC